MALLARRFSVDEICAAVRTARLHIPPCVTTDTTPIADLWELMYILTSDDAWRGGVARYVDQFLQDSARFVAERLLHRTQPEVYNPVDFMVHNFDRMRDPGFVRLLRVHLLAYHSVYQLNFVMEEVPPVLMYDRNVKEHSAIHIAIVYNAAPLVVLATLLEARVDVNRPMTNGTTPIMIAASAPRLALPVQKLDLLLRYGAAIDNVNLKFKTVLHHGVAAGNIEGVRLLLDARTRQIEAAVHKEYEYEDSDEDEDEDDDANSERSDESLSEVTDTVDACESSITQPTTTFKAPTDTSLQTDGETRALFAYKSRLCTGHLGRTLQGTAMGPVPLGWSGPVPWVGQFSSWHSPAGVVDRIENRLRCTTPMRVDLLNMRNVHDDTVLSFAAATPNMTYNARNEMVSMLLQAGADPEYETCSGLCQNSSVAVPGHQRIRQRTVENNFLVKGIITCEEQLDTGTFIVRVRLLKDGYTSDVCFDVDSCSAFINEDVTMYPASAPLSDHQLEELFIGCSGQTFDFWLRDEAFDCTFDGVDFSLFYKVTDRLPGEEGMDDILCIEIIAESAITYFEDNMGRVSMRFPRGPVPHAVVVNETIAADTAYMSGFRMHKHYTLLQQAAVCKSQSERARMLTVARPLCNPLLRLQPPHPLYGYTALELLEYTICVDGMDPVPPHARYNSSVDARWLKLLQKDFDDFMQVVFRDHALTASVDINAAYNRIYAATNGRGCKPKCFTSRFNLLPDDVCKRILGFVF
ncbi:hypothetical protein T484DRAFT_1755880 [Baffinella frigidus]|nr:hypothetical protein T484DRAFT_1755880 [Cryptophyta sp. CCMP2293]